MEGDHLIYSSELRSRSHGTGLLDEFMGLADADEHEFIRFGRKWVGLNVAPKSYPHLQFADPIRAWREVAIRMRALYRISADLSFGRTGRMEDWTAINGRVEDLDGSLKEARFRLMSHVRQLVTQAQLQPRLYWNRGNDGGHWQIDLDSPGWSNLLAVLTIQLIVRIADKDGFAICSICHRTYVPKRKPAASKRNYCDDPKCQRERWKHYKREQRRRKEEGNGEGEKSEEKTRKR
jgi:hypothetical protein